MLGVNSSCRFRDIPYAAVGQIQAPWLRYWYSTRETTQIQPMLWSPYFFVRTRSLWDMCVTHQNGKGPARCSAIGVSARATTGTWLSSREAAKKWRPRNSVTMSSIGRKVMPNKLF